MLWWWLDETKSESYPMAGFGISNDEPSNSTQNEQGGLIVN
jgi:hypothetical protein